MPHTVDHGPYGNNKLNWEYDIKTGSWYNPPPKKTEALRPITPAGSPVEVRYHGHKLQIILGQPNGPIINEIK